MGSPMTDGKALHQKSDLSKDRCNKEIPCTNAEDVSVTRLDEPSLVAVTLAGITANTGMAPLKVQNVLSAPAMLCIDHTFSQPSMGFARVADIWRPQTTWRGQKIPETEASIECRRPSDYCSQRLWCSRHVAEGKCSAAAPSG